MIKLNNMKLQTTAIICAYNEENTITNILKDVCGLHLFNEVIVINDGSGDNTGKHINELEKTIDIKVVHLLTNRGKGFAMAKGVEMASNEYLVFIDADLSNFTLAHAHKLLNPVLTSEANMVLGQPTKTLIHPEINPFRNLSGQRALKKGDVLPIIERMKTTRYGVETLINMHFRATNKAIRYVDLKNLFHPTKFQKTKPHMAIREFVQVACQIIATTFSNYNLMKRVNRKRASNIISIYN
jgi:glycosyltransferase involved in cell wall biosynthesis